MSHIEEKILERRILEQQLLSSIMHKNSTAFDILEQIGFNEECLDDIECRVLYKEMKKFHTQGERIILEVLPNPEFVQHIKDLNVTRDAVKHIAKQIWDRKVSKDIESFFMSVSAELDTPEKCLLMLSNFLEDYENALYSKERVYSMDDCYKQSEQYQNDDTAIGVQTRVEGFTDVFAKGELILIGARPSIGKTATGLNIIADGCRKGNVMNQLLFSLEQSSLQVYIKLISNLANISHGIIKNKNMNDGQREKYQKYSDALRKKNNLYICDESPRKATLEYMKAVIKSRHRKQPLDLVMIDYIQLVKSRKRFPSRREELEYICEELKSLAKELQLPIIILAQVKRPEGYVKKDDPNPMPNIDQIKDCGSIEQIIDQAYLLNRPSRDTEWIDIFHAKHRDGKVGGTKRVDFTLHIQRIGKVVE